MVVLSVIVVNTIVQKGPLVFLKLAQQLNGGWDGYFWPYLQKDLGDFEHCESNSWYYMNYTRIQELYGDEFNLSPRLGF